MPSIIRLEDVSKIYHPNIIGLDCVYFDVEAGEFVCVVGQSGSGKTTLAKIIIAEERPTKGRVLLGDWDITRIRHGHIPFLRRQIGVIFQDFKLLSKKTVYENISFALEVSGVSNSRIEKVVPEFIDLVGLKGKEKRFPNQLSGGEQQRVVIARALVHRPKVIIADEPTGNLDAINTKEVIDILKHINSFGTTVLLVTHNREIVNNLKKRVVTINNGQITHDAHGRYRIN